VDTSKEYIKMSDCQEIQEWWKPKLSDVWINGDTYGVTWIKPSVCWIWYEEWPHKDDENEEESICRISEYIAFAKKTGIWLPRQDQSQELLPKRTTWFENLYRFYEWMITNDPSRFSSPCTIFSSIEQLWLAFVMWELHQKRWDGNEWRAG